MSKYLKLIFLCCIFYLSSLVNGQTIYRYGTTAANFLEIGIGSGPNAMGEAQVSVVDDVSAIYWNPAGLSSLEKNSALFTLQPWLVDIDMLFTGGAFLLPNIGVLGIGITQLDYGDMDVTTLEYQDGTGEKFKATDFAATFTFSRKIVSWFAFGSSIKYIRSNIWHNSASAFAVDLGAIVNTGFFSFSDRKENGLNIGMSISNYGTRMKYDGIDNYQPIDISEYESGNYGDVAGQFRTSEWELPLLFRLGVSIQPIATTMTTLTIAADAIHPNNNHESVNIGASFDNNIPGFGAISIKGGIKSGMKNLNSDKNDFAYTAGFGVKMYFLGNRQIGIDYAYKMMGILGDIQTYTVSLAF